MSASRPSCRRRRWGARPCWWCSRAQNHRRVPGLIPGGGRVRAHKGLDAQRRRQGEHRQHHHLLLEFGQGSTMFRYYDENWQPIDFDTCGMGAPPAAYSLNIHGVLDAPE